MDAYTIRDLSLGIKKLNHKFKLFVNILRIWATGCWTRKIAEILVCVRLFYKAMEICKPKYLDTSVHSLVLETLFRQRKQRFLAVCKRRHFFCISFLRVIRTPRWTNCQSKCALLNTSRVQYCLKRSLQNVSLVLDAYHPLFFPCRWPVLSLWMSDVPGRCDQTHWPAI